MESLWEDNDAQGRKTYDPDLHLQTALRIHKRQLLNECILDKERAAPWQIKTAARMVRSQGIPLSQFSIDSEFIYSVLWRYPNITPEIEEIFKHRPKETLSKAYETSRLITEVNFKMFREYVNTPDGFQANFLDLTYNDTILYFHTIRLYWYEIRNLMTLYQVQQKYSHIEKFKILHNSYPKIYLMAEYLFCSYGGIYGILDYDQVMCIHDTITSRYLSLTYCKLSPSFNIIGVPTPELYAWGDNLLDRRGNKAFDVIKAYFGNQQSLLQSLAPILS